MHWLILIFLITWFDTPAYTQPPPRHLEEIAFDVQRNKLQLFGGVELVAERFEEPANLYEWDGSAWKRMDVIGPCGRRGPGWVYDENRKETFLIGGVAKGKTVADSILFDVWRWNGNSWKRLSSDCPVKEPEAVYDPVEKRILVYGEVSNKTMIKYDGDHVFELWQYKGNTWTKLSANGPDITGSRMITFDSDRKTLVVPVFENEQMVVWEWSGNEWEKSVCKNECPVYRTRFALGYHPVEKATYLFGGLTGDRKQQFGDFWKWNGKEWEKVQVEQGPSVRNSAHFVFGNNQLILYGGSIPKPEPATGIQLCNELWLWNNGTWRQTK